MLNNRTFGVTIGHSGLFAAEPIAVRPVLLAGGEQVGEAGMAAGRTLRPGHQDGHDRAQATGQRGDAAATRELRIDPDRRA